MTFHAGAWGDDTPVAVANEPVGKNVSFPSDAIPLTPQRRAKLMRARPRGVRMSFTETGPRVRPIISRGPFNGALAAGLPPPDAYTPPNLPAEAISRYSRQLLLPSFGPARQVALSSARALIVGCGGLGCPAALYLGASGVGHLALADRPGDVVELTNLHRQVGHTTDRVGSNKAESLATAVRAINPLVAVTVVDGSAFVGGRRPGGAAAEVLVSSFDVVLDCTDNVAARYLINDACVLGGVPLVVGAAVGTDGQLTVYNWEDPAVAAVSSTADTHMRSLAASGKSDESTSRPRKSSRVCLRCIFPSPPPPSCVGSCDTAGVLGPVPGVIGVLQALEAIKVLSSGGPRAAALVPSAGPSTPVALPASEPPSPAGAASTGFAVLARRMLIFDGADGVFRTITLRPARSDCAVCSPARTVTSTADVDYAAWARGESCALAASLPATLVTATADMMDSSAETTRAPNGAGDAADASAEEVCSVVPFAPSGSPPHLPPEWRLSAATFARTYFTPAGTAGTLLVDVRPAAQYALCAVPGSVSVPLGDFEAVLPGLAAQVSEGSVRRQMVVVCRRGNSSRVAVAAARGAGVPAVDVVGGLSAWPGFPAY